MNHKDKVKLARKLSGKQTKHFLSNEWDTHVNNVEKKVKSIEAKQKTLAELKRKKMEDKKA